MAETEKPKPKKRLGENIFGTAVRESSQAKTVRPGDPDTTGAKREKVADLPRNVELRALREKEAGLQALEKDWRKRGYRTGPEQSMLSKLRPKGTDI